MNHFPDDRELSDAKKLKALEEENSRLKKMVADLMLDSERLSAIGSNEVREQCFGT